ncbi:AAA family ATPase [Pedobacter frigiditerrae]|uniref:AAA family ATPase n=1 Tax=Pedobacter frigiditerrae TaxID=2530452 RepID=UPI002931BD9D|nr:AAA family ATPase [Pedobacter frigiditerrae]
MINKITLNKIASYKKQAVLETDKKVNLIYGLNGSGKSTFSNLFIDRKNPKFSACSVEGIRDDDDIHVYNQNFIYNNFFEPENLQGIFTLSKENKEAEIKIQKATKEILAKISLKEDTEKKHQQYLDVFNASQLTAKNKIWEIKTKYTGGDRVLEFCLEGLKSDGNKLLNYVDLIQKTETKPTITIEKIKEDVHFLTSDDAKILDKLPLVNFTAFDIENQELLVKEIVGNKNSSVAGLIDKLGNSDWVKDGLNFLNLEEEQSNNICPFCQEKTITEKLISEIKLYFDEAYERDINSIKEFLEAYNLGIRGIPKKNDYLLNPMLDSKKKDFEIKYNEVAKVIGDNRKLLEEKIKSPSVSVKLINSKTKVEALEKLIQEVNELIEIHNKRMENKPSAFEKIKTAFWELMRWDYDSAISAFQLEKEKANTESVSFNEKIANLGGEIREQQNLIAEQQKHTVNIEEAITSINNSLLMLGIDDFSIKKHSDVLYKIIRNDDDARIFQTLSEGEKMIISFLYFIEQCRGKKSALEANKNKLIIIDDPISSLSHIYVFNIGRLIKNEFLKSDKYEQIFILTHSLYFFYELTDTNKERRKDEQKLFRLRKNTAGTEILEMSYEEIQNDYHSYWLIIKDEQQPPALIANCMRNIIEYFYNFVEKQDLNNVFQKPKLQENKFDAFNRFINRESHSLGQNIFDYKEFNYDDFKDAFKLVFVETGYEKHYNKMILK